jgi:hypothetical protein
VVAPSNGGAPAVRPLLDGSRLPLDTALFRSEAPAAEEWGEVDPPFPVGHVLRRRDPERMPITFEDLEAGATGDVIRQLRCDTMAQVTATDRIIGLSRDTDPILFFIRIDDLIRSFAPATALWLEDGTGHLQAPLQTCIYYPARAADSTDLAAGGPFPLVVICMGNHQAFETITPLGPTHLRGHAGDGREIRQADRVTFGTEVLSYLGYSAASRTRPPDTPGAGTIDYLQEELARQGMVSVSVNTNAANLLNLWVETRADFVLAAVAQMVALNRDAASPFHNRVDFRRVAYVGHSRGGDAVLRALHKRRATPVKALVQLATTDITGLANGTPPAPPPGPLPPDSPLRRTTFVTAATRITADLEVMYLSIYGSRDGDVSGLRDQRSQAFGNPFRHYDRASAQRVFQFWHGGTHNRFNRFWEDADEEPLLDRAAGNLLVRRDHEARTTEAVSRWMRFVLQRETAEAHRFDGRTPTTIATTLPVISMWKFGPRLKTIDRFDDDTRADRNTLGGRNVPPTSGLVDEVRMANDNPPGAGQTTFQFMHIDPTLRASLPPPRPTVPAPPAGVAPTTSAGVWRAEIPAGDQNFAAFGRSALLTLRVTRHYDESDVTTATTPVARAALVPTVTVTVRDHAGGRASAAAVSPRGVPSLPEIRRVTVGGSVNDLTKYHFETWQVPLSAFAGADPHHVAAVEVELSGQVGHSIYIDTLSVVEPVP